MTGCQLHTNRHIRAWIILPHNNSLSIFATMFIWSWLRHIFRKKTEKSQKQVKLKIARNQIRKKRLSTYPMGHRTLHTFRHYVVVVQNRRNIIHDRCNLAVFGIHIGTLMTYSAAQ